MYNHFYILGIRYSVFLFSLITFWLNNLWEHIHAIKTWLQLFTKSHASKELFSFKNSIFEEKCRTFTKWKCKRNAINKYFFWENLRSRSFIHPPLIFGTDSLIISPQHTIKLCVSLLSQSLNSWYYLLSWKIFY